MFLDYYRLREDPFGVTPDPRFLYQSQTHREALASLFYGITSGRGFMALVAQPGMGKTTLLFHLLERLRDSAHTVFLFQTQCDSRELFRYLLADLGITSQGDDLVRMHEQLNEVLVREGRAGRRVVLIIDEAQNLRELVLETVRLLSDFETSSSKLLQIVLAGQPQLGDKLAKPGLSQFRQRISIMSRLVPFAANETERYIGHRLKVAGHKGKPLFLQETLALIAERSQGIPRNINNYCFNALSLGYALKRKVIDTSIIEEVLADLDVNSLVAKPPVLQQSGTPESPLVFKPVAQPKEQLTEVPSAKGNESPLVKAVAAGGEKAPNLAPLVTSSSDWMSRWIAAATATRRQSGRQMR